ncbi:uncharacterized protein LOC117113693 [Anneissia japonica]|uniref:uncharacterized protein LOC117113693 n=1 Tax=Anneissia japonica TaxID=1529436 RepID=UPI00142580B8|nr:uncharacterized protein LOC117113693 [Anneissia japonica]
MGIAVVAVAGLLTIGAVYFSSNNGGMNITEEENGVLSRKTRSSEEVWVEEIPEVQLDYVISGDTYPKKVDAGSVLEHAWVLRYKVEPEHTAINVSFEVDLPCSTFDQDTLDITLQSYALDVNVGNQTNITEEVKILYIDHDPVDEKLYLGIDISELMWINLTEPWKKPDCWWRPSYPYCYDALHSDCVFYDRSPDQTWDPEYCYRFPVSSCLPWNVTSECYHVNTTACLEELLNAAEQPQNMLCPTDINETDCIQINDRGIFFTQYDFSVPTSAPIPETYEKDFCGMTMESIWLAEETVNGRQYTYDVTIKEEDEDGCTRVIMRIKPIITTPAPTHNPFKALPKTDKFFSAKYCLNVNTTGFYYPPPEPIDWKDFNISVKFSGKLLNYVEVSQILVSTVTANITQSTKPFNQTTQAVAIQEVAIRNALIWFRNIPTFSEAKFALKHELIAHAVVIYNTEAFNRGVVITLDVPQLDGVYLAKFENVTPVWKLGRNLIKTSANDMFNSTHNMDADEITLDSVIDTLDKYHSGTSREHPDVTLERLIEQDPDGEYIIVQYSLSFTPFICVETGRAVDRAISISLNSRILSSVVKDDKLRFSVKMDFKFPVRGEKYWASSSRSLIVTAQPFVPLIPPLNITQVPDAEDDIIYGFNLSHVLEFSIKDIWMNVTCPDLVIIPITLELDIIHPVNITSDSNADIMTTTNHTFHIHFTELAPEVVTLGQQTFRLVNNGIAPHYSIICEVWLSFRKEEQDTVIPYLAGTSEALETPGIVYTLYARDLVEKEIDVMTTIAAPENGTVEDYMDYIVDDDDTGPLNYLMPVGSNATFIVNITMPEVTSQIDLHIIMPHPVLAIYYSRIIFIGSNIVNLTSAYLEDGDEDIVSWDMSTRSNLKMNLGEATNIADNLQSENDSTVVEFNVVLLDEKDEAVKDTEHTLTTVVTYTNGEDLIQQQTITVTEPDIHLHLKVANASTDADPGEIFQYYLRVNHSDVSQSAAHHINVSILLPYMKIYKHFLPYENSRIPLRDQLSEQGKLLNDEILKLYIYKLDLNEVIEGTFLVQISTKLMEGICLQAQVKYEMVSFYHWGRYYPYTTVSENVLNIRNASLKFIGTSLPDTPDKEVAINEQLTYRLMVPLPPITCNLTMEMYLPRRNVTRKIWEVQQIQKNIPEVLPIEDTFFDNGCYAEMRPCFCYGEKNVSFDASFIISQFSCQLKTDQLCTNVTDRDTGKSKITDCDFLPHVYEACQNTSKKLCLQNPNVTSYLQTASDFHGMTCNVSTSSSNMMNGIINFNGTSFNQSSVFWNSSIPWNTSLFWNSSISWNLSNCSTNFTVPTDEEICKNFSVNFCHSAIFSECNWAGIPGQKNQSDSPNYTPHPLDDYIGDWTCACLEETKKDDDLEDPLEGLNLTSILEGNYNKSQKPYQICSTLFANKSLLAKPYRDESSPEPPSQNSSSSESNSTTELGAEDHYSIPDFCFEEVTVELGMAKVVNTSITTNRDGVVCTFVGGNNHNPYQPGVKYQAVNLPGFGLGGDSVAIYVTMVISDEVENSRDETLYINTSSTFMYMSVPKPPPLWYEENCTCSKPLTQYFNDFYPLDCACDTMTLIGHRSDLCNCTSTFQETEKSYFGAPSCDCVNFCEKNVQYFLNQPMVKDFSEFDNTVCDCDSYKIFSTANSQDNIDYLTRCREMYFRNYTCPNVNHIVKNTQEECKNVSKRECWEVNVLQMLNLTWFCQCSSQNLFVDSNCSCSFHSFPVSSSVANFSIIQCQRSVVDTSTYHGDPSLCDCGNVTDANFKPCYCHDICTVNVTNACNTFNVTECEDVVYSKEYIVNDGYCSCEKVFTVNYTIQDALKRYQLQKNGTYTNQSSVTQDVTCEHNVTSEYGTNTTGSGTNTNANGTTTTANGTYCNPNSPQESVNWDEFVLYCNCSDVDIIIPDIKPVLCEEMVPQEGFECECFVPPDNETQHILDNWDYNLTVIDEAVTPLGDEFVIVEPELEITFVRIVPDPSDIVDSLDFVKFFYKIQHTDASNSPAYNLSLYLGAVNFTISNGSGEVLPADIISSPSCLDPTLCEITYDNDIGFFHLGFLPVNVEGASFQGTFSLALRDDVDFIANSIITGRGNLWYDSCVVDFAGRLYGPINSSDICHINVPNITAKLEFTTAYAYMYNNDEYDDLPNTFSIGDFIDIRSYLWIPEITLNIANYSIIGDTIFSIRPSLTFMVLTESIYVRNDTATIFLDRRQNPDDNDFHILYPNEQYDTAEFTEKGIVLVPGVIVNQADNIPNDDDYLRLQYQLSLKDDPAWKQGMSVPFTASATYYSDYSGELVTLADTSVELTLVEPRLNLRVEVLDYEWQKGQVRNTTGYTCEENTCCASEECDPGRVCVTDTADIHNCESLKCVCYSGFALNEESTCTAIGRTAGDILVFGLTVYHTPDFSGNAFDLYITLHSDLESDLLSGSDTMSHTATDGYLGNVRRPRLTQITEKEFQIYIHRFDHVVQCERFTVPYRIKPSLHVYAGQKWEAEASMNYRSSKPYDTPMNLKSRFYEMNETIKFPLFAPAPSVRFKMMQPSGQSSPINFEVFSSSTPEHEVVVNVREEKTIVFQLEVVVPKIECSLSIMLALPEGNGILLGDVTLVSIGTGIDFPYSQLSRAQATEDISGHKYFYAYFPNVHSRANTLTTSRSLDSNKQKMFKTMRGEQQPYPTIPECSSLNSTLYEHLLLLGCYHSKIHYFGGVVTENYPTNYNFTKVMTRDLCISFCSDRGYLYSGTMIGKECYCGTQEQFLSYQENGDKFEFNGTMQDVTIDNCDIYCSGENNTCGGNKFIQIYGPVPGAFPEQQCNWYSGLFDKNEDVFTLEFNFTTDALATKGIEEWINLQVMYDHGENKRSTLLPLAPYKIEAGVVELLMNVWVSPKMSGYVPGDYFEYYTVIRHAAHSTVTARDVYILWMFPSYIEYVNVTNHPSVSYKYRQIQSVENVETDPRIGIKFYVKTLFHTDVIGFHFLIRLDPSHTLPQGEYHMMTMTQVYYNSWGLYNKFEEDYTFDVVPHTHPVVPIKITFEVPSKYTGRTELDDIKLSTYNVLYDESNNILYACFFNNTINVYEGGCFMTGDLPAYTTETPHTCEEYCNCTYLKEQLSYDNCSHYEPRPDNCSCGCLPNCIEEMMLCEVECLNNTLSAVELGSCVADCKLSQTNCTQECCLNTCASGVDTCLLDNCIECHSPGNCSIEVKCADQCMNKNDVCSLDCLKVPETCQENCSTTAWDCIMDCDNHPCTEEDKETDCTSVCYAKCLTAEYNCDGNCCYQECQVNASLCEHQCTLYCAMDNSCLELCISSCNKTLYMCNETCSELADDVYGCKNDCYQNCSVTECTVFLETDCIQEDIYDIVAGLLKNYGLLDLQKDNRSVIPPEEASLTLLSVDCSGTSCRTDFKVANTSNNCSAIGTENCHTTLDTLCVANCEVLCDGKSSCIDEYKSCVEKCSNLNSNREHEKFRNSSPDFCVDDAINCFLMKSDCHLSCNSSLGTIPCVNCSVIDCASNYTQCVSKATTVPSVENGTSFVSNASQTLNLTHENSCYIHCNQISTCQQKCEEDSNTYICYNNCVSLHHGCILQCLNYTSSGCQADNVNGNDVHDTSVWNDKQSCQRQCEESLEICKHLFSHMMNNTVSNASSDEHSLTINCTSYMECIDFCDSLCANRSNCSLFSCSEKCIVDATHNMCQSNINCTLLSICLEHTRQRRSVDIFKGAIVLGSSFKESGRKRMGKLNHDFLTESRKRRNVFIEKRNLIIKRFLNTSSNDINSGGVIEYGSGGKNIGSVVRRHIYRIRRSLEDGQMNVIHFNISGYYGNHSSHLQSKCDIRHQYVNYITCLDNCTIYSNCSMKNCSKSTFNQVQFSYVENRYQNASLTFTCDKCHKLRPPAHENCYELCQYTDDFCTNCTDFSCSDAYKSVCNKTLSECMAMCDATALQGCNWCNSLACPDDATCFCERVCLWVEFVDKNNSDCSGEINLCTPPVKSQEMCVYNCQCKLTEYNYRHWRGLDSSVGNILGVLKEPYTLYGLSHDGRAVIQSFDYGSSWTAILNSVWHEAKEKELYVEATNLDRIEISSLEPVGRLIFRSNSTNNTFGVSGVGVHFLRNLYKWKILGTWRCCHP